MLFEIPEFRRGRPVGAIAGQLRQCLVDIGVTPDAIRLASDPKAALAIASDIVRPGDFVLFSTPVSDELLQLIETALARHRSRAGPSLEPADAG